MDKTDYSGKKIIEYQKESGSQDWALRDTIVDRLERVVDLKQFGFLHIRKII